MKVLSNIFDILNRYTLPPKIQTKPSQRQRDGSAAVPSGVSAGIIGRGGSQQLLTFIRKQTDISPNIRYFPARKWHPLTWFDRWYV